MNTIIFKYIVNFNCGHQIFHSLKCCNIIFINNIYLQTKIIWQNPNHVKKSYLANRTWKIYELQILNPFKNNKINIYLLDKDLTPELLEKSGVRWTKYAIYYILI